MSQRELAAVLGVSLGKTNFCLRRLVPRHYSAMLLTSSIFTRQLY